MIPDDKSDRLSSKVLSGLENVDDDLGREDVLVLKMSTEGNEYAGMGIKELPAVVFFDQKVPTVFEGKLIKGLVTKMLRDLGAFGTYNNLRRIRFI